MMSKGIDFLFLFLSVIFGKGKFLTINSIKVILPPSPLYEGELVSASLAV